MKQDRFLLGILVGIGILVLAALALFFTRQDRAEYQAEDTPDGVVHNYALALYRGDLQQAYGYLAEAPYKPTYNEFREAYFDRFIDPNNVGLEIGETEIEGDQAFVLLYLVHSPSDPFSSGYRGTETARLERQEGAWKIRSMPYQFWAYDWYEKPVE
jgi:hypothetical protein